MSDNRRLLTKTQLRAERLKPARGQRPASRYWQGMGWVYLYDAAGAVPMRPYRVPSPAQRAALTAGRELIGTALCGECGSRAFRDELTHGLCLDCLEAAQRQEEAYEWASVGLEAAVWLAADPLFLDTETTGVDAAAEIAEIAVLDQAGAVLLDTVVRPLGPMSAEARAVNGITDAELAGAPGWPAVAGRLAALLAGRVVIAHNADFDRRMLSQTCAAHALDEPAVSTWACTLDLLTDANGGRWPSLGAAMSLAGAERPDGGAGRPHRAAYDAECCRRMVLALASGVEPETLARWRHAD